MGDSFDGEVLQRLRENIDSLAPPQDATRPSRINGVCIPQRKFNMGIPPRISNLVPFVRQDGTYTSVKAAMEGDHTGLVARDMPPFGPDVGYTIILRFEWPGYAPHNFQLRIRDWRRPPQIIPLAHLATEVSRAVCQFLEAAETQSIAPEHEEWRVGPNGIQSKHLRLAALEQVTAGSYQPRLFWKP